MSLAVAGPASPKQSVFLVKDVSIGAPDSVGNVIDGVYQKAPPLYAVYSSGRGVFVQFSDDIVVASQQRKAIAPLNQLRVDIAAYIAGSHRSRQQTEHHRAQVAAAIVTCLEGDTPSAFQFLAAIRDELSGVQTSKERVAYLCWAAISLIIVLLGVVGARWGLIRAGMSLEKYELNMLLAVSAGAFGALSSVALSLQSRPTGLSVWFANVDAAVRILVGGCLATILILIVQSGIIAEIVISGIALTGSATAPQTVLLLGFIGGFCERLVPLALVPPTGGPNLTIHQRDAGNAISTTSLNLLRRDLLAEVPNEIAKSMNLAVDRAFSIPTPINYSGTACIFVSADGEDTIRHIIYDEQSSESYILCRLIGEFVPGRTYDVGVRMVPKSQLTEELPEAAVHVRVEITGGESQSDVPLRLTLDSDDPDSSLMFRDIQVPAFGTWSARVFTVAAPPEGQDLTIAISQHGAPCARARITLVHQ